MSRATYYHNLDSSSRVLHPGCGSLESRSLLTAMLLIASLCAACNRGQPYLVSTPTGLMTLPPPPSIAATTTSPTSTPASVHSPATIATPSVAMAAGNPIGEMEQRARSLDENNRQLHAQLAQMQQQAQLYKDQSDLMQRQLADVSSQLQQARIAAGRPSGLAPTTIAAVPPPTTPVATSPSKSFGNDPSRKSSARLTANTSNRLNSDSLRDLGYDVEVEGGVLRLRIPSDQLFQPSTSQLTPSGSSLLDRVAQVIRTDYSKQRIAIEGYTDSSPLYGGSFSTSHQLTSAQVDSVFEHLTRRNQVPATQLVTLAHGSNNPLQENQNPIGRAANRRIEFLVYPESY